MAAQRWLTTKLKVFSFLDDEIRRTLTAMTLMAEAIAKEKDLDKAFEIAAMRGSMEIGDQEQIRLANEHQQWYRDLLAGKVLLPRSFAQRRQILREYFQQQLAADIGGAAAYSKPGRMLANAGGFITAVKLRKFVSDNPGRNPFDGCPPNNADGDSRTNEQGVHE